MQKKLIAMAVVAAFSTPAFADVTMYGVVDAAVARVSQTGQKSDTLGVSGGLASSRLGAKAVEDLDNGMKAVVVMEYGFDTQTSAGMSAATARQQMLAVAGGFGTVATGFLQTTAYDFGVKFDPTAGSSVSPMQNLTKGHFPFLIGSNATASRAPRALAYISPNMGGVVVAVNHATVLQEQVAVTAASAGVTVGNSTGNLATASGSANAKTSATLISVNYDNGPFAIGGVYAGTSGTSAVPAVNYTSYSLGASYDLSVVKLFATYQSATNSATNAYSDKLYNFSAVAPVGPGAVVASYAKAKIGAVAGTNADGASYTVAYLQGLSKTTTAYAAFSKVTNGTNTNAFSVDNGLLGGTAANGASSTLLAVGLSKKF